MTYLERSMTHWEKGGIEAYKHFVEDYARALDESGWMIVPQPDMAKYGPWQMDSKFGPVPWWAKDINGKSPPSKPSLRVIDGRKQ
jgi:hypothetical protein